MNIARVDLTRSLRGVLVTTSLIVLGAGAGTTAAGAATQEVSCSNLQQTITDLANEPQHGEGDVIVLSEVCDANNLKSSSGVTLPSGSDFSIEGKQGTTSGFDGTGVDGPLLGTSGSEEVGTMSLDNLTFQHAKLTNASALSIRAERLTLSHDSFLENEVQGNTAHAAFVYVGQSQADCPPADGPPAIALTESRFSDNKLVLGSAEGGGAGALLQDTCSLSRNVLESDTFEGNTLESSGTAEGAQVTGGGLRFIGSNTLPAPVSQSANVFDSNRIVAAPPAMGNYGGGGEWLEGASLVSLGDRFSRNTIAGTSSSSYERWSWGAGIGISNLAFACSQAKFPESTLENAVVTGNAIGPGMEADLGGGGMWVGCTHLRVLDSTVTLNSAPYGAGIEGEPGDQLELTNSIVADDSPGSEIAGFEGEASASLTASFSDVCAAAGSSAPLPGAGNICANPLLANDGDSSSFDVHETESSPTIDAGSNALIPAGLTIDFYGNQRVLSGGSHIPACNPPESVVPILDAPVVDMGASEYGPIAIPAIAIPCKVTTSPPAPVGSQTQEQVKQPQPGPMSTITSAFSFPSLAQRPDGLLTLAFKALATGRLRVRASFDLDGSVVTLVKGRRRRVRKLETLTYGEASHAVNSPGNVALELEPTKRALAALTRDKHLRVRLSITFTATGATPSTQYKTTTVRYRAAPR